MKNANFLIQQKGGTVKILKTSRKTKKILIVISFVVSFFLSAYFSWQPIDDLISNFPKGIYTSRIQIAHGKEMIDIRVINEFRYLFMFNERITDNIILNMRQQSFNFDHNDILFDLSVNSSPEGWMNIFFTDSNSDKANAATLAFASEIIDQTPELSIANNSQIVNRQLFNVVELSRYGKIFVILFSLGVSIFVSGFLSYLFRSL